MKLIRCGRARLTAALQPPPPPLWPWHSGTLVTQSPAWTGVTADECFQLRWTRMPTCDDVDERRCADALSANETRVSLGDPRVRCRSVFCCRVGHAPHGLHAIQTCRARALPLARAARSGPRPLSVAVLVRGRAGWFDFCVDCCAHTVRVCVSALHVASRRLPLHPCPFFSAKPHPPSNNAAASQTCGLSCSAAPASSTRSQAAASAVEAVPSAVEAVPSAVEAVPSAVQAVPLAAAAAAVQVAASAVESAAAAV